MLVLLETPAGFGLFKVLDEGKLANPDDLYKEFASGDKANKIVKLVSFKKFKDNAEAVAACASLADGKLSKPMKTFLTKQIVDKKSSESLVVSDAKLGSTLKDKLGLTCLADTKTQELLRGIRTQMSNLITGLGDDELRSLQLGLSHGMARHTLKFSADKVDTMIVQAIGLLDDIDKELNTYAMRVREWYGWHFPEMGKIVTDHVQYAKVAKKMGMRTNISTTELSTILDDETETELKEAALISMGTEISKEDVVNIGQLCDQVIDLSAYRTQLFEYLQNRMRAVAPNLTTMVGELVGARLIAHAGSLINLAKHPASTVQILGAEKALFRALKTKHETPKYGLIYHASLIGQAAPKHKGKISRVLAAKCALSCRVDALTVGEVPMVGIEHRAKVEQRLRQLEGHHAPAAGAGSATKGKGGHTSKYDHKKEAGGSGLERKSGSYQSAADSTLSASSSAKKAKKEHPKTESESEDAGKKDKKKKKASAAAAAASSGDEAAPKKKKAAAAAAAAASSGDEAPKKKKSASKAAAPASSGDEAPKKKKKAAAAAEVEAEESGKKRKKEKPPQSDASSADESSKKKSADKKKKSKK